MAPLMTTQEVVEMLPGTDSDQWPLIGDRRWFSKVGGIKSVLDLAKDSLIEIDTAQQIQREKYESKQMFCGAFAGILALAFFLGGFLLGLCF